MKLLLLPFVFALAAPQFLSQSPATELLSLRGHPQTLHLYGRRGDRPVIVSSGDGGWMHLAPHVAELLAARGFFVVGFDVKSYLTSFTSGQTVLSAAEEPDDYRLLAEFAARGSPIKPVLIGVSEGAGLSVLAATDAHTQPLIGGVVGLGLPDINELGWRWKDSLIYLTHTLPKEPTFSTASIVEHMAPVPLAAIHSTTDEYVPLAEVQRVMRRAAPPKRLWIVKASNHSFSDNLPALDASLIEALDWIGTNAAR